LGGWWFKARPVKKLARPHLNTHVRVEALSCNLSYVGGIGRRITVQGWPWAKRYLKITKAKYLKNN
jgi:hypothetical protein